jgi:hypothetical protein
MDRLAVANAASDAGVANGVNGELCSPGAITLNRARSAHPLKRTLLF